MSKIIHSGGLGHEIRYIAFTPFENLANLGLMGLNDKNRYGIERNSVRIYNKQSKTCSRILHLVKNE